MMHDFLVRNHDELIERCRVKVGRRPRRQATAEQLANGVPLFLAQLERTLLAVADGDGALTSKISGATGESWLGPSEISVAASEHGESLSKLGFSVDQVVHDYGDLCQAITELAMEQNAPFPIDQFRTLNRCLDNAIADAVAAFSAQRDKEMAEHLLFELNERDGLLFKKLHNALQMATLSVQAMEIGGLTLVGATGSVLKGSLAVMNGLVAGFINEAHAQDVARNLISIFSVAAFVSDAKASAEREADFRDCLVVVAPIDPVLRVEANRELLLGALASLLGHLFRRESRHIEVRLTAFARDDRIFIEVEDQCGGAAEDYRESLTAPISRYGGTRASPELGLSIARQSIEAVAGTLTVRDRFGEGCVFTIELARCTLERRK